jgi:hypothetical protein
MQLFWDGTYRIREPIRSQDITQITLFYSDKHGIFFSRLIALFFLILLLPPCNLQKNAPFGDQGGYDSQL